MSWMRYGRYISMHTMHEASMQEGPSPTPTNSMESRWTSVLGHRTRPILPEDYNRARTNSMPAREFSRLTSYPRRTLDQFYYPALGDTSARDADQTISKWTGSGFGRHGRASAAPDSLLIMVDQLWCWVLDNSRCSELRMFSCL